MIISSVSERNEHSDSSELDSDESFVTRWLDVSTASPRTKDLSGDSIDLGARNKADDSVGVTEPPSGRRITFRASIESEDRAGDVIRAEGWELDNYRSNPVVLWAHRHDLLPVGKSVDLWIENGALMATIEFAPTEFAQQIRKLFEQGFLRGVSVGFRALKTAPRNQSSGRGTIFERQELLEISAAPVPMHPNALSTEPNALKADDSEQRELLPLFRQLTEIWQSISAVSN